MPSYTISIAAASAPLDTDLIAGERWKEQPNNRVLTGVALAGSAAAGDTEVDIFVDETRITTLFNSKIGFPDNDDLVVLESLFIPASGEISALVKDAPATNPINLRMDLEDV